MKVRRFSHLGATQSHFIKSSCDFIFMKQLDMLNAYFKHRSAKILSWPASSHVILIFCAFVFFPQILSAGTSIREDNDNHPEIIVGYGYRTDELNWNIAGTLDGTDPNILSELTWKDLTIHQVSLGVRVHNVSGLYMRNYFGYGVIIDGENQDSDFRDDDRQNEFSRSTNQADEGTTWDFSIGLGYPIPFDSDVLSFAPVIGYSYHQQELNMTDGCQVIPYQGAFSGLDSTYNAKWIGPWVGVDLNLKLKKSSRFFQLMKLYFGFEHHWADYQATADWNLRTDFQHPKSFEHEADGQGDKWTVGLKSRLGRLSTFGIFYEEQRWNTQNGIDRVFLINGQTVATRLNNVDWRSRGLRFEFVIRF